MKCMIQERNKIIPDEENWFGLKIKWGMWKGWVWGVLEWEKRESIERDRRKMREKSRGSNI